MSRGSHLRAYEHRTPVRRRGSGAGLSAGLNDDWWPARRLGVREQAPGMDHVAVHPLVRIDHAVRGESRQHGLPDQATIKQSCPRDGEPGFANVPDEEASPVVLDDLGRAPERRAMTGVPVAMDSIATSPNGSGQAPSITVASAPANRASRSVAPTSPRKSTTPSAIAGLTTLSKSSNSIGRRPLRPFAGPCRRNGPGRWPPGRLSQAQCDRQRPGSRPESARTARPRGPARGGWWPPNLHSETNGAGSN